MSEAVIAVAGRLASQLRKEADVQIAQIRGQAIEQDKPYQAQVAALEQTVAAQK